MYSFQRILSLNAKLSGENMKKNQKYIFKILFSGSLLAFLSIFPNVTQAFDTYCLPMENGEQYVCSFIATPPQFVKPQPVRDEFVLTERYGRLADNANVYREATRSSEIARNVGDGFIFSSIARVFRNDAGELWYQGERDRLSRLRGRHRLDLEHKLQIALVV